MLSELKNKSLKNIVTEPEKAILPFVRSFESNRVLIFRTVPLFVNFLLNIIDGTYGGFFSEINTFSHT